MTGRKVSRDEHSVKGELFIGRPLPAKARLPETLKKAQKADRREIAALKDSFLGRGSKHSAKT